MRSARGWCHVVMTNEQNWVTMHACTFLIVVSFCWLAKIGLHTWFHRAILLTYFPSSADWQNGPAQMIAPRRHFTHLVPFSCWLSNTGLHEWPRYTFILLTQFPSSADCKNRPTRMITPHCDILTHRCLLLMTGKEDLLVNSRIGPLLLRTYLSSADRQSGTYTNDRTTL